MGRLDNKVAIITGGSRGQGAAHARRFIKEGAKVVITDILEEDGRAFVEELGENAKFIKHDVANASEWEKVVSETEATFGPVNILVDNAGIALNKPIEEMTEEDYLKVIKINQVSVFLGMKFVLSTMKKANGGSIINISSASGFIGTPGLVAYDASKFAVRGLTKTAALEFAQYGIRVNSVHPGPISTPLLSPSAKEKYGNSVPIGRIAQPEEVTNLVLYLASDEASYSTGSEFIIDGGMLAR